MRVQEIAFDCIPQTADACLYDPAKLRAMFAAALESYAKERVSEWMISQSMATGHGDTLDDLLAELGSEIKRLRAARIREGGETKE